MESLTRRYDRFQISVDQVGYDKLIDVTVQTQTRGGRTFLLLVEWAEFTKHEGRALRGPGGRSYWFPAEEASDFLSARPGRVYSQHSSASNGYGLEFDSADEWTVDDLLNLAAAAYDGQHWPYLAHPEIGGHGDTNPFRPYPVREVATA